jgi:hypothetical protein
MRVRKNADQSKREPPRTTTSRPDIWDPGIPRVLVLGLILLPTLAFGQEQTVETSITDLTSWFYSALRWPVCLLGLMTAAGLARSSNDWGLKSMAVLTIAGALMPAAVNVLASLFG